MDRTQSTLIAIIVLAIAIVAGCFLIGNNNNDNSDSSIEGYWYQVNYTGYENGNNHSYDKNDDPYYQYTYNIDIKECKDNTFQGVYNGTRMVGTLDNGIISYYGEYNGIKTFFEGYIQNDLIYSISSEQSGSKISIYYGIYSKDPNRSVSFNDFPDLTGDWTAYSKCYMTQRESYDLSGDNLKITDQTGPTFIGTMEQLVNGSIVNVTLTGSFLDTNNGYHAGVILCNGENWNFTLKNDQLTLNTTMTDDTGFGSNIAAVNRSYARDDSPIEQEWILLENTKWRYSHGSMTVNYGNDLISNDTYKVEQNFGLKFTYQNGSLLSGTINYSDIEIDIVGYLYGGNKIIITGEYTDVISIYGSGTVSNGTITLNDWYGYDGYYKNVAEHAVFVPAEYKTEIDLIGHWYGISSLNTNDGTFTDITSYDQSDLNQITIFNMDNNGNVIGAYNSTKFSGILKNNLLWFDIPNKDGSITEFKSHIVNGYIISTEVVKNSDKEAISMHNCVYSLDGDVKYVLSSTPTEIIGTWTSPNGYSNTFGEDLTILTGNKLTIESTGTCIKGTMEQSVNGSVKNKDIYGFAYINPNGNITATLIDDSGFQWDITYRNNTLYLYASAITDNDDSQEFVEAQRMYTRDGSDPVDPIGSDINLKGKEWNGTATFNNGTISQNVDVTVKFTGQYLNQLTCVVTMGDLITEARGYVFNNIEIGSIVNMYDQYGANYHLVISEDSLRFSSTVAVIGLGSMSLDGILGSIE